MCQVKTIKDMGIDDTSLRLKTKIVSLMRIIGIFFFIQELRNFKKKKIFSEKEDSPMLNLQPGDIIRVRSKEEILRTLNINNELDGCFFMDDMWQYCGSRQKVLKKVDYFYDERNAKMYKGNHIVLLEGIYCSGKIGNLMPRCDRNCYSFWKEAWLEKIG